MSAGFKIVQTDAGYHTVLVAENGEPVMSSEVLNHRETAEDNVSVVVGLCVRFHVGGHIPIAFSDERTVQT